MKRATFVIVAVSVFLLGGFFYYQYSEKERHKFKVVFLNVGQGDATIIQFENGEKMLVDCGPDRAILSALGRNLAFYDRTIDYLLISHPDLDHYGGCIDVLKNYQVKEILTNGKEKNYDAYFNEWKNASARYSNVVAEVSTTMSVDFSTFQFFSPDAGLSFKNKISDNDYSVVFRLEHGGESFLFTGDMEEALEKLLVEKYCGSILSSRAVVGGSLLPTERDSSTSSLRDYGRNDNCVFQSDILKVGHHGSDGSSSELFISRVHPEEAVISVGKNKFGHPGLRAIRHLERAGAKIIRTDETGDIVFN